MKTNLSFRKLSKTEHQIFDNVDPDNARIAKRNDIMIDGKRCKLEVVADQLPESAARLCFYCYPQDEAFEDDLFGYFFVGKHKSTSTLEALFELANDMMDGRELTQATFEANHFQKFMI